MKLYDIAPRWEKEPWIRRIEKCRIALSIHGFLPDLQNARVKSRISMRFDHENVADTKPDTAEGGE